MTNHPNRTRKLPERVYKSKAGFFHVFPMANAYGVYNGSGSLVCKFPCGETNTSRVLEMAKLVADALEVRFQQ